MDIALFLFGALIRFWAMVIPKSKHDILKTLKAFTIIGLLLWTILYLKGEGWALLAAMILMGYTNHFIFQHKNRILPYFHEGQVIFWNVIVLYLVILIENPVRFEVIIITSVALSTFAVLLPKSLSIHARTFLFLYLCTALFTVDFMWLQMYPENLRAFFTSSEVSTSNLLSLGFQLWGLATTFTLFFRADLYSKHSTKSQDKKRHTEYLYLGSRFSEQQTHPFVLLSLAAILSLGLFGNYYYAWIHPSQVIGASMILFFVISGLAPRSFSI